MQRHHRVRVRFEPGTGRRWKDVPTGPRRRFHSAVPPRYEWIRAHECFCILSLCHLRMSPMAWLIFISRRDTILHATLSWLKLSVWHRRFSYRVSWHLKPVLLNMVVFHCIIDVLSTTNLVSLHEPKCCVVCFITPNKKAQRYTVAYNLSS